MIFENETTQYEKVCKDKFDVLFGNMATKEQQLSDRKVLNAIHNKLFMEDGVLIRLTLLERQAVENTRRIELDRELVVQDTIKALAVANKKDDQKQEWRTRMEFAAISFLSMLLVSLFTYFLSKK